MSLTFSPFAVVKDGIGKAREAFSQLHLQTAGYGRHLLTICAAMSVVYVSLSRRRRAQKDEDLLGDADFNYLSSGFSRICLRCARPMAGCECDEPAHGKEIPIHYANVPSTPGLMYPADHIVRWKLLYDATCGGRQKWDMSRLSDNADVIVAVLQQHESSMLRVVEKIRHPSELDNFVLMAYVGATADDSARKVEDVKKLLEERYDVDDPLSARSWLSATVRSFCGGCFGKLSILQLHALCTLAKSDGNAVPSHYFVLQDVLLGLQGANGCLFEFTWASIEMSQSEMAAAICMYEAIE